ncbi:MAG: InlB B-repeat-containing protein [Candidatus Natronoplasma sp.]
MSEAPRRDRWILALLVSSILIFSVSFSAIPSTSDDVVEKDDLSEEDTFNGGTVSRTTETQLEWEDHHSMEGLEVKDDDLVLEEIKERSETYSGYTSVDVSEYTSIYVELEGGGGAAAYEGTATWYSPGGDGGALEGWFDVSNFDELEIWVGEGGEYSDNGGPGGWGRHSGGDGGDYAGGGGGSTEILADGTFLAAADAGGGGGAWWDYGVGYTTYGGGGGARGGQGGNADNPGENAEGTGTGGDGADDSEEDGGDGSGEYDNAYWLGGPGWEKGGGGRGGEDPEDDGEDGSASIDYYAHKAGGERISPPLKLDQVDNAGESSIEWDANIPGNTDIKVYTAVTEDETSPPDAWNEATNGGSIPGINQGDDLTGEYLWTRQVFSTADGSSTPELIKLTEEIVDHHRLTVNSTEGGEVVQPGEGEFGYEYDEVVEIEAVPNEEEGYSFIEWTGDTGTIEDFTSRSTTIQMVGDHNISARFAKNTYELTIDSTDGGNVTEPGEGTFTWEHGDVVELEAQPDEGHHLDEWGGDNEAIDDETDNKTTIEMLDDYTITAEFEINIYELDISSTKGGGVIEPGEDTLEYEHGTIVDLEAVAEEHRSFVKWAGENETIEDTRTNQTTIEMLDGYTIMAVFDVKTYTLTIDTTEGVDEITPGEATFEYDPEIKVDLEAVAEEGYHFVEWRGDNETIEDTTAKRTTIEMLGNCTLTAEFEINTYTLDISSTEGGNVTDPGEGTFEYDHGTEVFLQAISYEDWFFDKWSGDHEAEESEIIILMDSDKDLTANFLKEPVFECEILSPGSEEEFALQDEIIVEFRVTNPGGVEGEGVIEFYVDGEPTGNDFNLTLGSEESTTKEFSWEPEDEGEFELEIRAENEPLGEDTDGVKISVVDQSPLLPWWGYIFILLVIFLILAFYWKKRREEHEKVLPMKDSKLSKIKKKRSEKLEELERRRDERRSDFSSRQEPSSQSPPPKDGKKAAAAVISSSRSSSVERCGICQSPTDPKSSLRCECGRVYHNDCLMKEGSCPKCGKDYAVVSSPSGDGTESEESVWTGEEGEMEEIINCPVCNHEVKSSAEECWACGADLSEEG